jgi:hypothetical protein
MKIVIDPEFEAKLKQMPCPECGLVGYLATQKLCIEAQYKDQVIKVIGEAWICKGGCDVNFMSDAMTEEFINKKRVIDGGRQTYIEVNRTSGQMVQHSQH